MPASSRPSQQSPVALRSACNGSIACLKELVDIHLAIDPSDRLIQSTDPDCVYRLRKALLHVSMLTAWTLDTDVMHVIAPEIRAAVDEIDNVFEEAAHDLGLDDLVQEQAAKTTLRRAKTNRETTSSYVHPSPQRLLLAKEHGGLGPGDDRRYYTSMLDMLFRLAFRYAVSLAYLSRCMAVGKELPIASMMQRIRAVINSVTPRREMPDRKPREPPLRPTRPPKRTAHTIP